MARRSGVDDRNRKRKQKGKVVQTDNRAAKKTNKEKSKNLLHSDALCDILLLVPQKGTVGVDGGEGTPVPIPNTAVKLTCAENTWLEAARENKKAPTQKTSS